MASNPYFNDEQRRRSQNPPKPQTQPTVRKIVASLDKASMQELKDINDNTLETALNTMDIKDGIKSFEDKFKEKFSGFMDQYTQDQQPLADQLPDFVGPRPPSLTDNSTTRVDNSVNVDGNNPFAKLEEHTSTIAEAITKFIELASRPTDPAPEPEPTPDVEPEVDQERRRVKDKDKEEKKFGKSILSLLGAIKDNTSGLLSRFIGYSLEALAKFAKWTLIIGSVVFAIDVLSKVIQKWFQDILAEGEASKELFGSYFDNIKAIAEKINEGLKEFKMDDLGNSLKNLFMGPFKVLGDTIKTAITEGIGNLIYALGEYTGSDTIMDAGRGMKISALRDKQKYGLDIDGDDLIMLKEQELTEQKEKEKNARSNTVNAVNTSSNWQGKNSYNQMENVNTLSKADQEQLKLVEAKQKEAELQKQITKEAEAQIKALKENSALLKAETDKENAANRKRVSEAEKAETEQLKAKPAADNDFDKGDDILNKDDINAKDKNDMEKILESLEEKNNSKKLNEDDEERYRDMLSQWQNRIAAVPESNSGIDKQPEPTKAPTANAAANNVQVNQKTVNNTVQHSVQRTDRKPLIAIA